MSTQSNYAIIGQSQQLSAHMNEISQAFVKAFELILSLDDDLMEIIALSLRVNFLSVFFSSLIGLLLGGALAVYRFPSRSLMIISLNALMGLPPVVVGLMVYLMLSNNGPLGILGLLYTPTAMIIAQTILITPIIAALTHQVITSLNEEYDEQLRSLGASKWQILQTLLLDGRYQLMTVILAGFGRALAEVGAVMIVGGNINHLTRVMTTAIALETSKGNLALALGLGIILILLSFIVNGAVYGLNSTARRLSYA